MITLGVSDVTCNVTKFQKILEVMINFFIGEKRLRKHFD